MELDQTVVQCCLISAGAWVLRDNLHILRCMNQVDKLWQVYIVRCADETLYTGIALDVNKRVDEHNHTTLAARYTRTRRPVELVYTEACESRSTASRREMAIKKLSRRDKLLLCSQAQVTRKNT
jgi:putative endonuclease